MGKWTTGLCGCFEDFNSYCCACLCPCVVVGRNINVLDQGNTSCCTGGTVFCLLHSMAGLGCLYSCLYRGKLRNKFGLPPEPCNDICTECWCLCCSIAQTYRELKNRNMDPALGGFNP
ncbi:hypothetical protein SELMODRAFT_122730 [Selaginella moellendorffii]|uniref:Uncharacterized protein n=1 Tax=Selaginella moellendorffii TaxID=88036 RepID=D8SQZ8_SELML|nr:hypothetical protein SELMODRAFT_122730 [Selaginella moellendorffii]